MYPVLMRLGPLTIYSYGVMVAVGFGLAMVTLYRSSSGSGLPSSALKGDQMLDIGIIALVFGIIGARLFYVALHFSYYCGNPPEIIDLSRGGLVWYGAFIAGFIAVAWYLRMRRIPFWPVADLFAPSIALAQAIGRIGCFLNGCCYGIEATAHVPWKVHFPYDSVARHPTQLYSSALLLALFIILRAWRSRQRFSGEIFLGYCVLYGIQRFVIEFFRGDVPRILGGLTLAQWFSALFAAIALLVFIIRRYYEGRDLQGACQ